MAIRDTAARRYAEAAFEIAQRDGTVDAWRSELQQAADVLGDERIARHLTNPGVPMEERASFVERTLGRTISAPVRNLVLLQLRRGRTHEIRRVADEFARLDDRRQGITTAAVTAAAPLTEDEIKALGQRLEQFTGGRVRFDVTVDPSLLGGLVVRVGDRLIDGSVRGRLERLRNQLVSGAL